MKRIVFAMAMCLSFASSAMDTVRVHTIEQLLDSIQPNRIILVAPGEYSISAASQMKDVAVGGEIKDMLITKNVLYSSGQGLTIKQVKNLTIQGEGQSPAETVISSANSDDNVLTYLGCTGIKILNLTVEHADEAIGERKGGVLNLNQSSVIEIDQSVFAKGATGINAWRSKNVIVTNTTITGCYAGIAEFKDTWSIKVRKCEFVDNISCYSMWYMSRCTDVQVGENNFTGNYRRKSRNCKGGKMFTIARCEMVEFMNNNIRGNEAMYFGDKEAVRLIQSNNTIKRNKFEAMAPPASK